MKSIIKALAPAALAMFGLASCSEDSWNNQLDGFDGDQNLSQVESVNYTLTDADYARFANNRFNKLLASQEAENGTSPDAVNALQAVANNHYITPATPADRYMPNLLNDSLFRYFTLSDGSAINVTYNEVAELPEIMQKLNGAASYEVSDEDYQKVYGSDTDYTSSFSPSHPATAGIPALLKGAIKDAESGDYVVVAYNNSTVDPVFESEPEEFEMSDVLKAGLVSGEQVDIKGIVTAVNTRGFVLSDKGGSILAFSNNYVDGTYAVGDRLEVSVELGAYKNCLQIPYDNASIQMAGNGSYTYPEPVELTPDYLVAANGNSDPVLAVYGYMTGTVNVSGNYMNLAFDGRTDVRGSLYNVTSDLKAELPDGAKVRVYGYFTQTSTSGSIVNANMVVTKVESAAKSKRRGKAARVVSVPSAPMYAAYTFNGSAWTPAGADVLVIQPSDYDSMGLTYGNFSGSQPAEYLPVFLSRTYPYAAVDKELYVVYRYYADKVTSNACAQWVFDGSKWVDNISSNGVTTVTNQFVKRDGKWQMDPSITLTLPTGKGQALSAQFYQDCVDWVKDNVPDGDKYITSYGNNDYYTGASAYQNNIDLRAGSARTQYAAAYEGMTDDEVVALMKKRFEDEVCPAVLKKWYPDLAPVGDFHPTVTIHFSTYNGTTEAQTIVYEVEAKGELKFVSCTWND